MRTVTVAATQMRCSWNREEVLNKAEMLVRKAAAQGANIILLQELFETPYFCQKHNFDYQNLATTLEENPAVQYFQKIARELDVVIPISFYEKSGKTAFNSCAVIDADGSVLGVYHKTHIPDGLPYGEKFYFTPGDTGFPVWKSKYGTFGIGICWDQWFPETARCLVLNGAEFILYPTAIGSEPTLKVDSMPHWRTCMQGHSAANMVPVVASNRVGKEIQEDSSMEFYGSSFITNQYGALVETLNRTEEDVIVHTFDLDEIDETRRAWGLFRDRRPEVYGDLLSHGK